MDGWESPPVIRKVGTVSGNNVNAIEILLVEDNPGDVRLVQEAVKRNSRSLTNCTWSATASQPWSMFAERDSTRNAICLT
jgi:hypothetical protein